MATADTPSPAPPADAASLPVGYRINEYVIDKPLGGGGFGITYLARDSNLDLTVAIKEYYPSDVVTRGADQSVKVRAGNEEVQNSYDWGLERFLDEARALAKFSHPNIVRVLRYFRENGTAYIVMEYESGLALKRWVPQNAPLTQRLLLSIIYPLLDGLEAVHKTGFLHRDIKPDNIYVRADGTPVLLDFGAARRVTANQDMTNIVSPGFAPFEQYHSQGNQGPWTDIYSLGAVMYWMTTGKKPIESASRVKNDPLLPASALAQAEVFGADLLRAIEWAMHPDESSRPQSVIQLRSAIQGSERSDTVHAPTATVPVRIDSAQTVSAAPSTSGGLGVSGAASRRNLLCTIMFLDLVGYSVRSVDDQVAIKKLFNEMIGKALRGVDEDSRIAIDTGDGAAICFLGDPEEALRSAMLLRDLLGARYGGQLAVRIGLHMGPVRVVSDLNERVNVVGDGINVAQRVMDFAAAGQVLVSRAYFDVVSRITDDTAGLFRYLGPHEDKHARVHELYVAEALGQAATQLRQGPATGYTQTLPVKTTLPIEPEELQEIEAELARHIGPLAKVLVRKGQALASTGRALREALAPSIQDAKAREGFVAGPNSQAKPGKSQPLSQPPGQLRGQPLSQPLSRPMSRPPGGSMNQPAPRDFGHVSSPSIPLGPSSGQGMTRPGASVPIRLNMTAQEMAVIEQTLSKFVGPMARMLVRKETTRHSNYRDFIVAVAAHVDQSAQREVFMQAIALALPSRKT